MLFLAVAAALRFQMFMKTLCRTNSRVVHMYTMRDESFNGFHAGAHKLCTGLHRLIYMVLLHAESFSCRFALVFTRLREGLGSDVTYV